MFPARAGIEIGRFELNVTVEMFPARAGIEIKRKRKS